MLKKNIDVEFNLHRVFGPGKRLGSLIHILAVAAWWLNYYILPNVVIG